LLNRTFTQRGDYSDRAFTDRYLAQETTDQVESAFIASQVKAAAARIRPHIKSFSSDPAFVKLIALELAGGNE
jgi:hypothetical protein